MVTVFSQNSEEAFVGETLDLSAPVSLSSFCDGEWSVANVDGEMRRSNQGLCVRRSMSG